MSWIQSQDSLADAPEDAWDMPALGDGSALAWRRCGGDGDFATFYIAAESGWKAAKCEE